MEALILSADVWRMTDEKTGEVREGATVFGCQAYREDDEKSVGYKPVKFSAPVSAFQEIKKNGIGLYQLAVGIKPDSSGKPTVVLNGVRFVKASNPFATAAKAA